MLRASRKALLVLLVSSATFAEPAAPDAGVEFDAIVSSIGAGNHDEVCQRMAAWVRSHRGDAQAARGLLWMARVRRSDHQDGPATSLFEQVIHDSPGSDWALHASEGLADIEVDHHHYASALARYRELANQPNPFWQYLGKQATVATVGLRLRFFILVGIVAALCILALLWIRAAGGPRALWPPPAELVYMAPILIVLSVAATAQEPDESHALLTLAGGAASLLWIHGAYLRARRPRGAWLWLQGLLALAQAAGILYCAMVGNHLWAKLVDTMTMGAE